MDSPCAGYKWGGDAVFRQNSLATCLILTCAKLGKTLYANKLQQVSSELTPQDLWSRYDRHFVGITSHNVWN